MVRYERGLRGRLNCVPLYFPHPSHPYSILEHGDTVDCLFFAVLTGNSTGIYTHFSQILTILRSEPDTDYISSKTWVKIIARWRAFCGQEHDHPEASVSRSSSPDYSASAFDTSPCPSPTDSRRTSLDLPHPDLPPLTTSGAASTLPRKQPLRSQPASPPSVRPLLSSPTKTRTDSGSSTKNRDNSMSQSSTRTFAQVSSPRPAPPFSLVRGSSELRFPTPVHTSMPAIAPFPSPRHASPLQYEEPACLPEEAVPPTRVLYAVSVCNRLLVSQRRAYDLFANTEGAEMLLAGSLGEAAVFFEHFSGPHKMYAVSGERKAFRDREQAFNLFLQKPGAQMLFSNSPNAVEAFIREHVTL